MDPQDVGRSNGPRQTCSVSWDRDPDKLIRPRSADSIKACGHHAAPIGRTHDRKRLLLPIPPKVLADRGPSTHDALDAVADRGYFNGEEIVACDQAGITVTMPKPLTSGAKSEGRFGRQDFVY